MAGVDKAHRDGYLGEGITVAVIDTGIDYTHPSLGGGYGTPDSKVVGGFDFVGDDYTGSNTPIPDPDPMDSCNGHGTHVAGIIGAEPGNEYKIRGVAYRAKLYAYRVFGCKGFTTEDLLVDAMLLAYTQGADVINLSIGGADGWTDSTASAVASRIAKMGKVLSIAAGNNGGIGSWYTSNPGGGLDVICVGSIDKCAGL
jgi:subtilisin family serine protease